MIFERFEEEHYFVKGRLLRRKFYRGILVRNSPTRSAAQFMALSSRAIKRSAGEIYFLSEVGLTRGLLLGYWKYGVIEKNTYMKEKFDIGFESN